MKVACIVEQSDLVEADAVYLLYGRPTDSKFGSVGAAVREVVMRRKLQPTPQAWDFLSLALSVIAADDGCTRAGSPDGWTRTIELRVPVQDPKLWSHNADSINEILGALTGDYWSVSFVGGGVSVPKSKSRLSLTETGVALLSGGLDSLVGAIDQSEAGASQVLVSQVASGDKATQAEFASTVGQAHFQFNHVVATPWVSERSQRARSIIFIAYGVLVATALDCYQETESTVLRVPENGFISINPPLTRMRIGTLSTRTTHPGFLRRLQALLDAVGIRVSLVNPYQLITKGEMLKSCANQKLLRKLAKSSTSCGRYARTGFQHCGRCVPCLVRRAAFHRWGVRDPTGYRYSNLAIKDEHHAGFDDVRAVLMAVEQARTTGIARWAAGALLQDELTGNAGDFLDLVKRGLKELARFMAAVGAK